MTIHYTLCFLLLVAEMFIFLLLITPLPHKARRVVFRFIGSNPVVGQILYGVKITTIFVAVLFVDAVQRLMRSHQERQAAKEHLSPSASGHHDLLIKLAFAQRNAYLCGFTLFCSLILARTYSLISDLIETQDKLKTLEKSGGAGGADVATLKKQVAQQQAEYNRLADELAKAKGQAPSTKSD